MEFTKEELKILHQILQGKILEALHNKTYNDWYEKLLVIQEKVFMEYNNN